MRFIKAHLVGGHRSGRVFTLLSPVATVLAPVDGPFYEYRLVREPPCLPNGWPDRHYVYVDVSLSEVEAVAAMARYLLDWQNAHSS